MAPRTRKVKRCLDMPARFLTANRRNKIIQFKKLCKIASTDYGVLGSLEWNKFLLNFMDEGRTLTIEDINRWVRMHSWITEDDHQDDTPENHNHVSLRPNCQNQRNQVYDERWSGSTMQWPAAQATSMASSSSHFSGSTNNSSCSGQSDMHMQYQFNDRNPFNQGYIGQPYPIHQHQHQHHENPESFSNVNNSGSSWTPPLKQEPGQFDSPTPRNIPNNVNMTQFEEVRDADTNNLYSEEVLSGLTEMVKLLAQLNKYCGSLECVRSLLVPLDKMVTTVLRAQRKCTMVIHHKGALAAKTGQLRQIKMEQMNGQGTNTINPNQPPALVGTGSQLHSDEDFQVEEIDISDQ